MQTNRLFEIIYILLEKKLVTAKELFTWIKLKFECEV